MRRVTAVVVLLFLTGSASAAAISYDVAWAGANNYSLTGTFQIDDSLLGTGAIDESSVLFLSIEAFLDGESLGSSVIAPENFNFDTNTETFIVGDLALGPLGQAWNIDGPGIGFASGRRAQSLYIDGAYNGDSRLDISLNTLTATRTVVPVPAALWLFGSGLALLAWVRRRH